MAILVFGDSITYGCWDEQAGWSARLRKFLDKSLLSNPNFDDNNAILVYNCGISGDTTAGLLERLEDEAKRRLGQGEEAIIIFAIGINDSQFVQSKNGMRTSPDEFQNNLEKLILLARKFSQKIVFLGLTPVDEAKTVPISWDKDKTYKNEYIQKYNDILKLVCKKNKVYFIKIFEKFMKMDYKAMLKDGLHPNTKGHAKIFGVVKRFFIKNKIA